MEDFRWILRKSSAEAHIKTNKELCKQTGINARTLRDRFIDPSSLRVFELRALNDVLNFSDEDLLKIVKGNSQKIEYGGAK